MSVLTTETFRDYIDLTKPRLLPLVLLSGLPVMGMSTGGWAPASLVCCILVGICLAAASANTLNAYLEIDKDSLMERTRGRPLPAGRITPRNALIFGIALAVFSTVFLYWVGAPPRRAWARRAFSFMSSSTPSGSNPVRPGM